MADTPDQPTTSGLSLSRERKRLLAKVRRTWYQEIVDNTDQLSVLQKMDDESKLSGRYIFMTAMSAAIAVLGLLLSSPAVVIGAMLLSPLMGPIIGAGFALVVGDPREMRRCAWSLAVGSLLAIVISAIVVFLSPIQTVTPEVASRTQPSFFDLLVALFSGLAGAYAMIRGRDGTIVGVAIATALMPPLAVIGFGLATFNWTVFGGSLLLFITNLTVIAISAALMARFYGFTSALTKRQTRIQVLGIVAAFIILGIPLSISLQQIAWETNATRQAQIEIRKAFPSQARITQLNLSRADGEARIDATVLTPTFNPDADRQTSSALTNILERPVSVEIDQLQVGANPGDAEAAELAAARARAQAEAQERQVAKLADNLAMVAGVERADILLDRERSIAIVRARPIPGAGLATYRELERRVAERSEGWTVRIRPPAMQLPDIAFDGDTPDPRALALVAWAGQRIETPVELIGTAERTEIVRGALASLGFTDVVATARSGPSVGTRWASPDRASDASTN